MNSDFIAHWLAGLEVISKYYLSLSTHGDKIVRQNLHFRPFFDRDEPLFLVFCVVYTKTIIHLSVGECGWYLPRCFVASWLGKYPLLLNINCQWFLKVCAFLLIGRCNYFSSVLRHSYYTPKTNAQIISFSVQWHIPPGFVVISYVRLSY